MLETIQTLGEHFSYLS